MRRWRQRDRALGDERFHGVDGPQNVIETLRSAGAFDECMYGRGAGLKCRNRVTMILQVVGLIDGPTVMWSPSCDSHADALEHWALTQMLPFGTATRHSPSDLCFDMPPGPDLRILAPGSDSLGMPQGVARRSLRRRGRATHKEVVDLLEQPDGRTHLRLTPDEIDQGKFAEFEASNSAAVWGLPDFVFRARPFAKGSGVREVGDCVLVLHDLGAVVQVKRRSRPSDDPEKERRWIEKHAARASRQASGTIRWLKHDEAEMTSARGDRMSVDAGDRTWLGIVILDHPDIPIGMPEPATHDNVVTVTRTDWDALFAVLKSTHAVVAYLADVVMPGYGLLGREAARLQYAIESAAFGVGPSTLPPDGGGDESAIAIFRTVLEQMSMDRGSEAADRLEVLSLLDSLPFAVREQIGVLIGDIARDFLTTRSIRRRLMRGRVSCEGDFPQVVFVAANRRGRRLAGKLNKYILYKHMSALLEGNLAPKTVGFLITPTKDLGSPTTWDLVVMWTLTSDHDLRQPGRAELGRR